MKRYLLALGIILASCAPSFSQGLGNTVTKHFPGAPSGGCSKNQLGINDANGNAYTCPNGSWVLAGGGGSGSGTVTSVSTTAPITGGTITTTGTIACATCETNGGTPLTSGTIPKASTSPAQINSALSDNGTTISSSEPVAVTGAVSATGGVSSTADGVHNGTLSLVGNTTDAVVPANTVGFGGPNTSATGTAYRCDLPWTNPSGGQVLSCGTPAAGVSTGAWVSPGTGTVTSVATTAPLGGGTITGTGTLTCTTCVVASSPGIGLAHFAGSTQTVTSSAANLASADVTGLLPNTNLANPATTVNGQTCTLGSTCLVGGNTLATFGPLTAQAANIASQNIFTVGGSNAYLTVCIEEILTQAASSSSVFPSLNLIYTSAIDSNQKFSSLGVNGLSTGNGTFLSNVVCARVFAKASTTVGFQTGGYTSVGVTPMQYAMSATVQQ